MGRPRKAWLVGGDGGRIEGGRRSPGFTVRWNDRIDRTRVVSRSRRFTTEVGAKAFLDRLNRRLALEAWASPTPSSLEQLLTLFFEEHPDLPRTDRSELAESLAGFVQHAGNKPMREYTAAEFGQCMGELRSARGAHAAGVAILALRGLWTWALDLGYVHTDITTGWEVVRG